MLELIKEYNTKKALLQAEMIEKGRGFFQELFDKFFDEYPEVETLKWTQYTPYFNDGSPCEFSVGELHAWLKGGRESQLLVDEGAVFLISEWVQDYANKGENWAKEEVELYNHSVNLVGSKDRLNQINDGISVLEGSLQEAEDFLYIVYGDHVQVSVSKGETLVEEYGHE